MWWILAIIVLIPVILGFSKKFRPRKNPTLNKDETEEDRVYRLVEEKKAKARELRLPEIIISLYLDQIIHYPAWMKRDDRRDWVPSEVRSVEEIKNDPEVKQTKIDVSRNVYMFKFESHSTRMPNGTSETNGTLELWLKEKKILVIDMLCEYNQFGSIWTPYGLQTFIDGDWVKEFQELKKHTIEIGKKREDKNRNSPQKIKDLKNNFNID